MSAEIAQPDDSDVTHGTERITVTIEPLAVNIAGQYRHIDA